MAEFHDRMKAFTDRLKSSIEDRGDSLANVHQATVDLLGGARMFLNDVAHEHKERAEELNEFLSNTRARRDETVTAMRESHRDFLDNVAAEHGARAEEVNAFLASSHDRRVEMVGAMRDNHREELDAMRDEMRHTLDEANKARHHAVDTMTDAFRTARVELSKDLHGAAMAWREFATTGRSAKTAPQAKMTPPSHPAPAAKPKPVEAKSAEAKAPKSKAKASGPKKAEASHKGR